MADFLEYVRYLHYKLTGSQPQNTGRKGKSVDSGVQSNRSLEENWN